LNATQEKIMSGSLNLIQLIGNVGKDPELHHTQNGTPVCRMSVATGKDWTDDKGQKHSKTEWHTIVCWKKLAELVARYSRKGAKVYVSGEIETRSWDDNGQKRYATEVKAAEVKFLSSPKEESPPSSVKERRTRSLDVPESMGDQPLDQDIPF
jgi:single-strand DNA-binding protein